jgi:hypothetical protein
VKKKKGTASLMLYGEKCSSHGDEADRLDILDEIIFV